MSEDDRISRLCHYNKTKKEIVFVELKSGSHKFHEKQEEMMLMLKNAEKRRALLVRYDGMGKKKVSEEEVTEEEVR